VNEKETLGKLDGMDDDRLSWGFHPDPYGIHEERYISCEGEPTKLVRDRGVESYDTPPTALNGLDAEGIQVPGHKALEAAHGLQRG
jgi:hypothetical protein